MKFSLDTDDYRTLKLAFSESDHKRELSEIFEDFSLGLASFFAVFASNIRCSTEDARELKKECLSFVERCIDVMLRDGVLELEADEDESFSESAAEDLDELTTRMREEDFSEAEIARAVELIKDCGSLEAATDLLGSMIDELKAE